MTLTPTVFSFDAGSKGFNKLADLADINGEARDAKWLRYTRNTRLLILARNNNSLIFLKPKLKKYFFIYIAFMRFNFLISSFLLAGYCRCSQIALKIKEQK